MSFVFQPWDRWNQPMLPILLNYNPTNKHRFSNCKVWEPLRWISLWHIWRIWCSWKFSLTTFCVCQVLMPIFSDLQTKARESGSLFNQGLQERNQKQRRSFYKSGMSRGQGKAFFASRKALQNALGRKNFQHAGDLTVEHTFSAMEDSADEHDVNHRNVRM